MRFQIYSYGPEPLAVVFEPMAAETVIRQGDYITVEWQGDEPGAIAHRPEYLEIGDPAGGLTNAWNSSGKDILY
ncbi:hypothetical protein [Actinomadura sp. 3N508]|uniref:hypothetical protein n=1 Tax=Actinomadura sp. 3N508 TaxID=3375153 RepID=UPI0037B744BC